MPRTRVTRAEESDLPDRVDRLDRPDLERLQRATSACKRGHEPLVTETLNLLRCPKDSLCASRGPSAQPPYLNPNRGATIQV